MSDEYVENLKAFREKLIDARRSMVKSLAKATHVPMKNVDAFANVQRHIEAVDRAIEDEQKLAPSSYETRGLHEI
jgi:hypothetical protein